MALREQDLLVLLKMSVLGDGTWTYESMAKVVYMSSSQVHGSVQRLLAAQLAVMSDGRIVVQIGALLRFVECGLAYVFYSERGEPTIGMPTAHAAEPLKAYFADAAAGELPPVWPDPLGPVRGITFKPLCKSAPQTAREDARLYEL